VRAAERSNTSCGAPLGSPYPVVPHPRGVTFCLALRVDVDPVPPSASTEWLGEQVTITCSIRPGRATDRPAARGGDADGMGAAQGASGPASVFPGIAAGLGRIRSAALQPWPVSLTGSFQQVYQPKPIVGQVPSINQTLLRYEARAAPGRCPVRSARSDLVQCAAPGPWRPPASSSAL